VATLPETVSVTMRRGSMAKPAAAIFPSWLSVVWPGWTRGMAKSIRKGCPKLVSRTEG
jgi:hypothetical protein